MRATGSTFTRLFIEYLREGFRRSINKAQRQEPAACSDCASDTPLVCQILCCLVKRQTVLPAQVPARDMESRPLLHQTRDHTSRVARVQAVHPDLHVTGRGARDL